MDEKQKFDIGTIERVNLIKVRMEQGDSIDAIIKEMKISEDEFFQYYELVLSEEYNRRIVQFGAEKQKDFFQIMEQKEKEQIIEKKEREQRLEIERKQKINPISVLTKEDLQGAQVLAVDYSINLSEVKSYYLGSLYAICKRYWFTFNPVMSEETICQKVKEKMKGKGFHNVRNIRLLDSFLAFMEYQEELQKKKKRDLVYFEMDDQLLSIAKQRIGL